MSHEGGLRRQPARLPPGGSDPRAVAKAINLLNDGKGANFGHFTLELNTTTTTVLNPLFSEESHVTLTPLDANAAAELGAGTLYVSARTNGSFTLTHANNASTREFSYGWTG